MSVDATQPKKRKTLDAFFKPSKKAAADKKDSSGETDPPQPIGAKDKGKGKEIDNNAASSSLSSPAAKEPQPSNTDLALTIPEDKRSDLGLELGTIDPSWLQHLQGELTKPYFLALKKFLREQHQAKKTIYPPAADLYSWSRFCPLYSVKVVILGQDPYHGPDQAHGLAFSVRPKIRTPPSLLNMYKALERDFPGFSKPSHGYLRGWAQQGVLLLNASLTVEAHKPNSHAGKGWELFTDAVIRLVDRERTGVVFMLWGAYAQKKGQTVDSKKHLVLKAVHPSPLSASRGFFDAGHFKKANEYLRSNGKPEIDWSCLPDKE
ncbi:uracil DNA glycosylase [Coemansia erecta]|uniref:Uracil-DNA glycosylase n=1 Tax=Coemansia asiatica TaxID=1052880 RepID=A0A9W8CHN2_9FUNG|nr:uracil DNA glycosylase [Coemansia asiatica]KAJ2855521.1 uracil DNA glycosylase [Coemansia erecta]KAJ2880713.1 uracil DNA glycosylase [Coemansia asiatica]